MSRENACDENHGQAEVQWDGQGGSHKNNRVARNWKAKAFSKDRQDDEGVSILEEDVNYRSIRVGSSSQIVELAIAPCSPLRKGGEFVMQGPGQ